MSFEETGSSINAQTVVRHRRKRRAVDPICHRDVGEHIVVEHLVDERHVLVVAERHLEDIVEQGDDGAGAECEIDRAEVGEGERMQKGGVDGGGDIDEDRDGVGEGDVEEAALEEEGRAGGDNDGRELCRGTIMLLRAKVTKILY